jgi:hypothetical protein
VLEAIRVEINPYIDHDWRQSQSESVMMIYCGARSLLQKMQQLGRISLNLPRLCATILLYHPYHEEIVQALKRKHRDIP